MTDNKQDLKDLIILVNKQRNISDENFIIIMKVLEEQEKITMITLCNEDNKLDNDVKQILSSLFFALQLGNMFGYSYEHLFQIWMKYYNLIEKSISYDEYKDVNDLSKIILLSNNIDLFKIVLDHDIEFVLLNLENIVSHNDHLMEVYNKIKDDTNDIASDIILNENNTVSDIILNKNKEIKIIKPTGDQINKINLFNQCLISLFNKKYNSWSNNYNWTTLNTFISMSQQMISYILKLTEFSRYLAIDICKSDYDFFVKMLNNNSFCEFIIRKEEYTENPIYYYSHNKWRAEYSFDESIVNHVFAFFVINNDLKKAETIYKINKIDEETKLFPINIDPMKVLIEDKYNKHKHIRPYTCNLLHVAAYHKNNELFNLVKNKSDQMDIEAFEITKFLIPMAPLYRLERYGGIDFSVIFHKKSDINNTDKIILYIECNSVDEVKIVCVEDKKYELVVKSYPSGSITTMAASSYHFDLPIDVESITYKSELF